MGCDWLHFGGCCVGYAIRMGRFYRGTPYEFEEFREDESEDEDEDEDYENEDVEESEDDEDYESDDSNEEEEDDEEGQEIKKAKVEASNETEETDQLKELSEESDDESDEEEEKVNVKYGRRLLFAIRREWHRYMTEFHPKVDRNNIPGFQIICPTFLGQYESVGIADDCYLIWGYNLNQKNVPIKISESRENWTMEYVFPENSREMYVDFIARFYLRKCKKNKHPTPEEMEKSKKNASEIIKSGVFGSVCTNSFAL